MASNPSASEGLLDAKSPGEGDVCSSQLDGLLEETLVNPASLRNDGSMIAEPLTRRETQILRSIIAGKTNKQIARALCRSQRTVEYHRHRLMRKLNACSPADLVRQAIAIGIA
jgi:DNA-binding NarL/FixJ family response regulator